MNLINRDLEEKEVKASKDLHDVLFAIKLEAENASTLSTHMGEGFFDKYDGNNPSDHTSIVWEFKNRIPYDRMLQDRINVILRSLTELTETA